MFALLGNELRVEVLRALADAGEEPLSFSALRAAVGERDSGKFNYHLGKLVGTFVRHVEADDEDDGDTEGYELTLAGQQVVGALVAGTYTADGHLDAVAVDDPCPACGARAIHAAFDDDVATLSCHECDEWYNSFGFPPGTLDQYEPEELPAAFDRWMYALFQRITAGFCWTCAGRLTGELKPEGDHPTLAWSCDRCGSVARSSAATPLLFHPAGQGFLYDHGVDPNTTPSWRLLTMDNLDQDADGTGADVTLRLDGEELRGRVDATGKVVSVERSDR
ncbi:DUF7351 domain-containing protein [Halosegnis marinus]|uniref:DUF7351 domain-containing protein n=1 Tax=Halosegnis marinus TaxID=3034023 RepID=UPI00360E24B9